MYTTLTSPVTVRMAMDREIRRCNLCHAPILLYCEDPMTGPLSVVATKTVCASSWGYEERRDGARVGQFWWRACDFSGHSFWVAHRFPRTWHRIITAWNPNRIKVRFNDAGGLAYWGRGKLSNQLSVWAPKETVTATRPRGLDRCLIQVGVAKGI